MNDHEDKQGEYASAPCYAHELDPLYRDLAAPDSDTRRDVMRWRKAERERLRALRNALDAGQRAGALLSVSEQLDQLLQTFVYSVVLG